MPFLLSKVGMMIAIYSVDSKGKGLGQIALGSMPWILCYPNIQEKRAEKL